MAVNFAILVLSLFLVIKSAAFATRYASGLARNFRLSQYAISFLIVTVISVLPEAFISVNSAIQGTPSFGLGMLFGSNVADLTLIFALIIFFAGRGIKIENRILKSNSLYPFALILPVALGMNGYYSRFEGVILVAIGFIFFAVTFKNGRKNSPKSDYEKGYLKNFVFLFASVSIMMAMSYLTVYSATKLAGDLGVSPIIISMLVVGLGTTLPELFFCYKSVEQKCDSLAVGDILGTVLADAIILVGLLAAISPFSFPQRIVYVTGVFMFVSAFILFYFMRSGKNISKKEGVALAAVWLLFVVIELSIGG